MRSNSETREVDRMYFYKVAKEQAANQISRMYPAGTPWSITGPVTRRLTMKYFLEYTQK